MESEPLNLDLVTSARLYIKGVTVRLMHSQAGCIYIWHGSYYRHKEIHMRNKHRLKIESMSYKVLTSQKNQNNRISKPLPIRTNAAHPVPKSLVVTTPPEAPPSTLRAGCRNPVSEWLPPPPREDGTGWHWLNKELAWSSLTPSKLQTSEKFNYTSHLEEKIEV